MAKKIKETSISALDKACDKLEDAIVEVEWNGITLNIKKRLGFSEMVKVVESVADLCFIDGEYYPEIKEFARRCAIAEHYGNCRLPEDSAHKYKIVYDSDLIRTITHNVDINQLDSIDMAIEDKIEYRVSSLIDTTQAKYDEIANSISNITVQIKELFSGIDKDTLASLAQALAGDKFNPDAIVETILDKRKEAEEKADANKESVDE